MVRRGSWPASSVNTRGPPAARDRRPKPRPYFVRNNRGTFDLFLDLLDSAGDERSDAPRVTGAEQRPLPGPDQRRPGAWAGSARRLLPRPPPRLPALLRGRLPCLFAAPVLPDQVFPLGTSGTRPSHNDTPGRTSSRKSLFFLLWRRTMRCVPRAPWRLRSAEQKYGTRPSDYRRAWIGTSQKVKAAIPFSPRSRRV